MALRCSSEGFGTGIVIIANHYLSRHEIPRWLDDWFHIQKHLQTYLVHSDKQGLGTDPLKWDRPSNTVGFILIPCQQKSNACVVMSQFPLATEDERAIGSKDFEVLEGFRNQPFPRLIHLCHYDRHNF